MTQVRSSACPADVALQHFSFRKSAFTLVSGLLCCTALTGTALAQAPAEQAPEEPGEEIIVTGSLDAMPVKNVGSIFGFDKTLVETPRSASSVSSEQIERFGITDIYDLVAQAPGTFTNSFFGVGGALDTMGQLEAHLIMRHYEGFLKKGRIQGRWFNVGSGVSS